MIKTKVMIIQEEAMKPLQWMVGHWKGDSWMDLSTGKRGESNSEEHIRAKLGGMVLLIEGRHVRKVQPEIVTLEALALVSYDVQSQQYTFVSHTHDGQSGIFRAVLQKDVFQWFMKPQPGLTIRHSISQTSNDKWFEVGEHSKDGHFWKKFFEMTLSRI